LSLFRRCGFLSTTSDTLVRDATHENLLLVISQLERIDLFIYGVGGKKKNGNVSKVHPAGANRPERPRVCRKEWGKREYGPRERSNFWAIAGQFRRVPNPPLFGGGPPSSRSTAETDVARDRAILHSPLSVSHLSIRVQNPAHSLSLSLIPYATLVLSTPGARWRVVCVRAPGEKPPAMIAVYGREKPSRSDDNIAISSLSRNSNAGKKCGQE